MDEIDRQTQLSLQAEFNKLKARWFLRAAVMMLVMLPLVIPMAICSIARNILKLFSKLLDLLGAVFALINECGRWLGRHSWIGPRLVDWVGPTPNPDEFLRSKYVALPPEIRK
jgi:hypothetical protein